MNKQFFWIPENTPSELHSMLRSLGELFCIAEKNGDCRIDFERIDAPEVTCDVQLQGDAAVLIRYNTVAAAARGIGNAMANITGRQSTGFSMLGIMVDLSRNLVFKVSAMQKLFRRLALLGFNTVLLYCEDTYELPGEPAFGMMRGRYTAEEIRAMDDAAAAVGIELIGCIQTLGHMGQVLRWSGTYLQITDTPGVMRVDKDATHELIGKMLDFWSSNLRSRRIHVGMDETHDLGRGTYLDNNGYTPGFDLFTFQLNKVNESCLARGLQPMIWSDMFFRLGNKNQAYYDLNSDIPQEVRAKIPGNVQLVYWDYYTVDQDFYEKFIDMHREIGGEPIMGAGLWIWSRLWYDHRHSAIANRACINGCRNKKLKEIFFTMWGDDGAICHWDSAWTGLAEVSDLAYGIDDEKITSSRYTALTGSDYFVNKMPSVLHCMSQRSGKNYTIPAKVDSDMAIFWDDVLQGLGYRNLQVADPDFPANIIPQYSELLAALAPYRNDRSGANLNYAWLLTRYMLGKLECRKMLIEAYSGNDRAALKTLAAEKLPALAAHFTEFMQEFRKQWLEIGKPFGLETMQHRMGGQLERIKEASIRINEYLSGVYENLEELEQPLSAQVQRTVLYRDVASGSTWV